MAVSAHDASASFGRGENLAGVLAVVAAIPGVPKGSRGVLDTASTVARGERRSLVEIAESTGESVRISPTYSELRAAGAADAHHIIQDAAVRDAPGYSRSGAPALRLDGPSTRPGTPHYNATRAQEAATVGGTYGAERQVAACALAAAGCSPEVIDDALQRADRYFIGELGDVDPVVVDGSGRCGL